MVEDEITLFFDSSVENDAVFTGSATAEFVVSEHGQSGEWEYDSSSHWNPCTFPGCDNAEHVSNKEEHSYSAWAVSVEATDTTAGEKKRTCSVCGYVETAPINGVKVYRLYNKVTGEHLYTTDENEYNSLPSIASDWQQEPDAKTWTSPEIGTVGVYRLYNTVSGDHHYTTDQNEIDTLTGEGFDWKLDNDGNPLFYSADATVGEPVYRLFNADPTAYVGSHLYTTDQNERDTLITWSETGVISAKWRIDGSYDGVEGIGWYGLKTE
jgi:hypothetical protein